ncbi:protein O17 [Cercopithecine betaherpesvirus 5]|uniref:Protein O17 n=1 Tax=Simian cytomegalovirus (strain Colburn) TaxID=50292 RepID=G8XTK1_SCMVC|nr:protein O17 [Cercopithecine betaherpesvirus 5]AEV80493.1 protein O17 [Cercopithecine betaherpesvirus 5]
MNALLVIMENLKRCLRRLTTIICGDQRRPFNEHATTNIKLRTAANYFTSTSGHTFIDLELNLSDMVNRYITVVNPVKFAETVNEILAKEVTRVLDVVQKSGRTQTSAEVQVFVSGCPATLAPVLDSEFFVRIMDAKFEAALDSVLLNDSNVM